MVGLQAQAAPSSECSMGQELVSQNFKPDFSVYIAPILSNNKPNIAEDLNQNLLPRLQLSDVIRMTKTESNITSYLVKEKSVNDSNQAVAIA